MVAVHAPTGSRYLQNGSYALNQHRVATWLWDNGPDEALRQWCGRHEAEVQQALRDGARELDMVINIS